MYVFLKISLKKIFFFVRYMSSLPYSKALCKRKLISIKKWIKSTDYKNIAKVRFPFISDTLALRLWKSVSLQVTRASW